MTPTLPRSVLFLCNQNAVRSPIAEALAKAHVKGRIYIDSAGLHAGPLDAFAVTVMEEIGIDLSGHQPKSVADLPDLNFELVIPLSRTAEGRLADFDWPTPPGIETWPIPDAAAVEGRRNIRLDAYRDVRDRLRRLIEQRFVFD